MKLITATKHNDEDWSGKWMREDHYDTLLKDTCRVVDGEGNPLAVVLKGALLNADFENFLSVMRKHKWSSNNRGTSSGEPPKPRVRKDGTLSKTTVSVEVESGMFGYFERTPRFPYCRACAFNIHHPDDFSRCLPKLQEVSRMFAHHVPERYENQKRVVQNSNKDFVIPGTVFTTVTVNRNYRTAAHLDAGDLEEGFSCMSVGGEGIWKGANLVLPNYRIAFELRHGDLIIFQPHVYHGNTPLIKLTPDAARWSFVHYYRTKIQKCRSATEELEIVKRRTSGPLYKEQEDV